MVLTLFISAAVLGLGVTPASATHRSQPSHWDRTSPLGTTAVSQMYVEDHTVNNALGFPTLPNAHDDNSIAAIYNH